MITITIDEALEKGVHSKLDKCSVGKVAAFEEGMSCLFYVHKTLFRIVYADIECFWKPYGKPHRRYHAYRERDIYI